MRDTTFAPIVALHCTLGASGQWRSLAEAMPERRVFAPNLLGYGETPMPAEPANATLDDEVDALDARIIETFGDAHLPLHLVGHSYGGATALRFAQRFPHRVHSLSLFEPVLLWLLEEHAEVQRFDTLASLTALDVAFGRNTQALKRFLEFWGGEGAYTAIPAERRDLLARLMDRVVLNFTACAAMRTQLPPVRSLRMPTLLMHGSAGFTAARGSLERARSWFSDCASVIVPGGHMAPVEHRARVDAMIATFVRRQERVAEPVAAAA